MSISIYFQALIENLPRFKEQHNVDAPMYQLTKRITRAQIEAFYSTHPNRINFAQFGSIYFPYCSLGAVDTLNFFDIDELIIFSFYWANRKRYKNVLDLGANIGLHSVILNRCGYNVKSYEPDPFHFKELKKHLKENECDSETFNVAVSTCRGVTEFVRVLGNTTGSHLKGAKQNPYGKLDYISVELVPFTEIIQDVDLIKMDIEGHEKEVILSTNRDHWKNLDMLVEVGNETNAKEIFKYLSALGINMFSQKIGWNKVNDIRDIPSSYKEGTLFISMKNAMPWTVE